MKGMTNALGMLSPIKTADGWEKITGLDESSIDMNKLKVGSQIYITTFEYGGSIHYANFITQIYAIINMEDNAKVILGIMYGESVMTNDEGVTALPILLKWSISESSKYWEMYLERPYTLGFRIECYQQRSVKNLEGYIAY